MAKARTIDEARRLTDLPNVGKATARDLQLIGIHAPRELVGRDANALYDALCHLSGARHDPCVLDVLTAAIDFAEGAPARPWWAYSHRRKQALSRQKPP
ncbi:MAG: helix-hairpin-helix domain-containing protein [Myxococcaceae bacterium]|nr:helix-hairpin-helix domain-containing protein [Myxococcaceae bacterium]